MDLILGFFLFVLKNYNSYFDQIQLMEENQNMLEERNKEISNIVRSIQDLNDLFKDLATMIVDQVCIAIAAHFKWPAIRGYSNSYFFSRARF